MMHVNSIKNTVKTIAVSLLAVGLFAVNVVPETTQSVSAAKVTKTAKKVKKSKKSATKSSKLTAPAYTETEFDKTASQAFLNYVNKWRNSKGLKSLKSNYSNLKKTSALRAYECNTSYSHTRPNGTSCFTAFKTYGVSMKETGEVLGMATGSYAEDADKFAYTMFYEMVYNDAASNWEHRDILKSKSLTHMAVSVYQGSNGTFLAGDLCKK